MLADIEAYKRKPRFTACGGPGTLTITPLDARWCNCTGKNRVGSRLRRRKNSVNIEACTGTCGVINYLISMVTSRRICAARKSVGRGRERTPIRSCIVMHPHARPRGSSLARRPEHHHRHGRRRADRQVLRRPPLRPHLEQPRTDLRPRDHHDDPQRELHGHVDGHLRQ